MSVALTIQVTTLSRLYNPEIPTQFPRRKLAKYLIQPLEIKREDIRATCLNTWRIATQCWLGQLWKLYAPLPILAKSPLGHAIWMESHLGSDWSWSSKLRRIQGPCRLIFLTKWIKMLIKVQIIFPVNVEVNTNSTPRYLLRNMQHIASSNSAVYSEEMSLE